MTEQKNKMPDREPDFYLPIFSDYYLKGWREEGENDFTLIYKLEFKDGNETVYVEKIFNKELPIKVLKVRYRQAVNSILKGLVKNYVVNTEKSVDLKS